MTTTIDNLLESYRAAATTERDKGTYFERLCAAFLTADPVQREQYETVWTWSDWAYGEGLDYAGANGWTGKDVGIDLVAKLLSRCCWDWIDQLSASDLGNYANPALNERINLTDVWNQSIVSTTSQAGTRMKNDIVERWEMWQCLTT